MTPAYASQIVTDARVARFVGERIGAIIYPPFTCMGIERDGEIVAGAVFNCFTGHDVEITVAGRGWTRAFFRAVGQYAFEQLKCGRVQVTTEDEKIARLAERLGGQREGLLRDKFGPGKDGIVLGVLKREYKFNENAQSP
ncbi:MAG: GNAT family protein [Candidatus Pacebacteria bacterium]|nr:GNAT family protein [Candidatus Paceibacterota bacterium]